MEEKDFIYLRDQMAHLMQNSHDLGISLIASNSRLGLVEAFNNQLGQSQIEMREMVAEMVHQMDQLKAMQNMLAMRLNQLIDSQQGSGAGSGSRGEGEAFQPKKDITATLQKLRNNL